ncbi:MAG: AAA family ATPase [Proteobacteria bacterium]|nr:AAA family ATPase [Pseudomonadota bacterium]
MAKKTLVSRESEINFQLPDWMQTTGLGPNLQQLHKVLTSAFAPPVLLLIGPAGVGKRHLASFAAAHFFCEQERACGTCSSCLEVLAGIHPEILFMSDREQKSLKTSDMLKVQEFLSVQSRERFRVVVICDCDRLTPEAANRMLKTLEEPPEQARIILTTSRVKSLLPTLLGRCLQLKLKPLDQSELRQWISKQFSPRTPESFTPEMVETAMRFSGYSPGKLLDIFGKTEIAFVEVIEKIQQLFETNNSKDVLKHSENLSKSLNVMTQDLLAYSEFVLNQNYRNSFESQQFVQASLRRQKLSEVRRLAVREKIVLNHQLAAESIGLAPFIDWDRE